MTKKPLAAQILERSNPTTSSDRKLSETELIEAIRERQKLLRPEIFSKKRVKVK